MISLTSARLLPGTGLIWLMIVVLIVMLVAGMIALLRVIRRS